MRREKTYFVTAPALTPSTVTSAARYSSAGVIVTVSEPYLSTGALVVKSSVPTAAFVMRERNITASFRDCLQALSEQRSRKEEGGKRERIRRLEAHIEALKQDPGT